MVTVAATMVADGSSRPRALPVAAALVGASGALVELAAYRLDAAVYGWGYARLVAAVAAGLGGLVAAWIGARASRDDDPGSGLERGATSSGAAAVSCALAAIALTWSSQRMLRPDGMLVAMLVPLAAWTAFGASTGVAIGALLRHEPRRVGRQLFAVGLGAAVGGLFTPAALALGCPRTLLVAAFLFAGAAWSFARATGVRRHRAVLLTIPLALLSLSLGDIRYPWLKVRTDVGRKGRVGLATWTHAGLFQVDQGKAGGLAYTVDRSPAGTLSLEDKGRKRQAFELSDMAYFGGGAKGAALIVESGGGREVREARDAGHSQVDVVERTAGFTRAVAHEFGAEWRGVRSPEVTFAFGSAATANPANEAAYERIVVVGEPRLEPLASRFVSDDHRAVSVESLRAYVGRLAEPRGTLLVRGPKDALPDLLATLAAAAPQGIGSLVGRLIVCSERKDDGATGALFLMGEMRGAELASAEKSCKRKGLTVELTTASSRRDERDAEAKPGPEERLRELVARGRVVTEDRPFLGEAPTVAGMRAAARESLKALRTAEAPRGKAKGRDAADKEKDKNGGEAGKPPAVESPRQSGLGIATSAAALVLVAWVLALFAPFASGRPSTSLLGLRVGVPLQAVGLGIATLAVGDVATRLLGGLDAGHAVVVPTWTLTVAAGALLADVARESSLPRWLTASALVGVLVLVALGSGASVIGSVSSAGVAARYGVAFFVLLVGGGACGLPLGLAMRLASHRGPAPAAWGWGAHLVGVATGLAIGQVAVRALGVGSLALLGASLLGVGALMAAAAWLRGGATAGAVSGA